MEQNSADGILPDFFSGIASVFRGINFFLQNRELWKYALLSLAATVLVYILAAWGLFSCCGVLSARIEAFCSRWPAYLSWIACLGSGLLYLFALGIFGLIVIFCSGTVYEITSGPFLDHLVEKISLMLDRQESRGEAEYHLPSPNWAFILRSLWDISIFNLCSILLMGIFFLLSFLTGGLLMPLAVLITGYRLGITFLAIPGFCYGKGLSEIRHNASRHKALITGFGTTVYLLYWIPFGLILLLPGTVCASVLLLSRFHMEGRTTRITGS